MGEMTTLRSALWNSLGQNFLPFGVLEVQPDHNLTSACSVDTWQLPVQAEMMACWCPGAAERVHTENECTSVATRFCKGVGFALYVY